MGCLFAGLTMIVPKHFTLAVILAIGSTGLLSHAVEMEEDASGPPNIIVFMADDVGWDDVGFHGSNNVLTPNIDVLAADGIILNEYYTSPLCTPSRSAFLSGVHPIDSGDQHYVIVNGEPRGFSLEFPLLPQILKRQSNYTAHLIGKWNLGFYKTIYTPNFRGFDSFYGYYGNKIDYFTHEGESGDRIGLDWRNDLVPEKTEGGQYATHLLTRRAMDLIAGHDKQSPMFMQISYPNTHVGNSRDPHQAPADYVEKFNLLIPDRRKAIYAANLFTMDESVGMILHSLNLRGMLKNSIVAFLSDNGSGDRGIFPNGGSNFPLRGVKSTLFEGGIRVPAFIWSPLLKQKSYVFDGLFHVTDWLPTFVSAVSSVTRANFLTSHEVKAMYGTSMWDSLQTKRPSPRRHVLHNIDPIDKVSALRVGKYKLLSGVVNPELAGWYGDRIDVNVSSFRTPADSQAFILQLREESLARRTLAMIGRTPSYSNFASTFVVCHKSLELKRFTPCNSDSRECLFNIGNDPCEINNLANDESHSLILREMRQMMKQYESSARVPQKLRIDPESNPNLHHGVWSPWKDTSFLRLSSRSAAPSLHHVLNRIAVILSILISLLVLS